MTFPEKPPSPPAAPSAPAAPAPLVSDAAWRRFSGFAGGCMISGLLGILLTLALTGYRNNPASCAVLQFVYLTPAIFFLIGKRWRFWALGFLFGGAIVFLLAGACNNFVYAPG